MSARPVQRANVIAGLFLVVSLALAVSIAFVLSDAMQRLGSFREYVVRFDVAEGVAGVKIDSPVTLGGLDVGRVVAVEPVFETTADGAVVARSIDVRVSVDEGVVLYTNADAYVVQPILGTLAAINIAHAGGPNKQSLIYVEGGMTDGAIELVGPDDPLNGAIAPALLTQMGLGPDEARLIKQTIEDTRRGVGTFRELGDRLRPAVDNGVETVEATLESFRRSAARIDERSEEIADDIVVIVDEVRGVSERLDPTLVEVDGAVADARAAIAEARAIVEENRPIIRSTTGNVERITARFEAETLLKIEELLDQGVIAAGNFADTGERAESLLAQTAPNLRRAVANARIISDQASLFVQEVRAAPWRLLERPKTRELREQLLYDATRAYAAAVGDLRSASETLDATLAGLPEDAARRGVDPEGLAALAGEVRRAFGSYRRAESALLELVTDGALDPPAESDTP